MATSADWLEALGLQLAAASDDIEIFRDVSGLLDQLEEEPSQSLAEVACASNAERESPWPTNILGTSNHACAVSC